MLKDQPMHYERGMLLIHGMPHVESIIRLASTLKPKLIFLLEADIDLIASRLLDADADTLTLVGTLEQQDTSLFFVTESNSERAAIHTKALITNKDFHCQSYSFSLVFMMLAKRRKSTSLWWVPKNMRRPCAFSAFLPMSFTC